MTNAATQTVLSEQAPLSGSPGEASGQNRLARLRIAVRPLATRVLLYTGLAIVAGVIGGWVWHAIVKVPTYLTSDDGSVQMTERAVSQIFSIDAIFVIIGLLVGLALGLVAWLFFRKTGWPVALAATLGGLLAGGVCWLVGVLQGPSNFAERVASANPGDQVPIDFQLHTGSALLVWALGAIIPVMLYANLSREDDKDWEIPASLSSPLRPGASDIGEGGVEPPGQVTSGKLN